jgi:solute carrier family 25 protein 38
MAEAPAAPKKSLKAAHHLTSGALSGLTSAVCLQPLDLLKTRLQQGYNVGRKRWVVPRGQLTADTGSVRWCGKLCATTA